MGQLGDDANAKVLRDALASAGVDLTHLRQVPGPSGTALIMLQKSGVCVRAYVRVCVCVCVRARALVFVRACVLVCMRLEETS